MNPYEIQIGCNCDEDDGIESGPTEQDIIDAALAYAKMLDDKGYICYLVLKNDMWHFGVDGMELASFLRPEAAVFFAKSWLNAKYHEWIHKLIEVK